MLIWRGPGEPTKGKKPVARFRTHNLPVTWAVRPVKTQTVK